MQTDLAFQITQYGLLIGMAIMFAGFTVAQFKCVRAREYLLAILCVMPQIVLGWILVSMLVTWE